MNCPNNKILRLARALAAVLETETPTRTRRWKTLKLDHDSRRLKQLLDAGFNKSEIARRLGVHRNTIRAYLKRKK